MKKENYRNIFAEIGKSEQEIQERLKEVVDTFFYGEDKVYFGLHRGYRQS